MPDVSYESIEPDGLAFRRLEVASTDWYRVTKPAWCGTIAIKPVGGDANISTDSGDGGPFNASNLTHIPLPAGQWYEAPLNKHNGPSIKVIRLSHSSASGSYELEFLAK